ncbi:MAG TPA: PKD domain-containing protein [Ohtaekwangia sp.]
MRTKIYRLVFFLALTLPAWVTAQDFSGYNWYFGGGNTGIRFSRSTNAPAVVTNKFPLGTGGSAVATDPTNGNLIFYSDGTRIIDASHQTMPNGIIIGNNTRNQPVAICQNPAASSEYFVFVNNGTVRFSVVDSAQIGNATGFGQPPLGDVVSKDQVVAGSPAGLSEAMIMLPDPNGNDFWLMVHRQTSNEYHFIKITSAGPTYVGSVSIGVIESAANFSFHPATNRIAVAPQEANRDVEIFTIAFSTAPGPPVLPTLSGITVVNTAITSAAPLTQAIYDTEFSPNGLFLYVSVFGEGAASGDVLQYDLTDLVPPTPTAISVLPTLPTESYGLQMGPDSVIYHLYQSGGSFFLGALSRTDSIGNLVLYNPNVFPGNFGGRQFPSFAPADSLDMSVFFTADGLCANAPTSFFPTVSPGADSLVWDFGDGTADTTSWSPVHTYTAGGSYPVRVTAFLNGQSKDTLQTINVANFDLQIDLVQDTTACSCELPFPKATNPPTPHPNNPCNPFTLTAQINGTGTITWQWFGPGGPMDSGTGTTAVLQPDSAGYYYLVATAGGSCSTHAGVNIKEYDVQDERANFWYFGQNAGIDFNPAPDDPIIAVSNPVMNTPEGTSIICDQNGQVVIFTDGNTLWRRDFSVVATGLGGDPESTQSSLIVPVPQDETLYYIFTTQRIYGSQFQLSYSLFDLKLNGGIGGMVETNVKLFAPSTERITSDGNWLIAHEYGNNSFRAYLVSNLGIGNPVISSVGSDHSNTSAASGEGYMEVDGNRLAVALSTPTGNFVEVFDFNNGVVSNLRSLNLNTTSGQVYGLEFAGEKLFATLSGGTSRLYEFAFDTLGVPHEIIPTTPAGPPQSATVINERLGAIQRGPNGQIYVAVDGKDYLGVINVNGDTTALSTFVSNDFPLQPAVPPATTSSTLGLPNFINNITNQPQSPSISFTGICEGDSTYFTGSGVSDIDTLTWAFGDGTGVTGVAQVVADTSHMYPITGVPTTYFVTLSVTNRCEGLVVILRDTVVIFPPPPDPTQVLSLCTPPQILDALTDPTYPNPLSYVWDMGATTQTISVSLPGTYPVTVTDTETGCSSPGDIQLFQSLTRINLGRDQEICTGTPSINLNTGININTHTWLLSVNNGPYNPIAGNTSPNQLTDFATPAIRSYAVEFLDAGSGCYVRDTVTFTINQSPAVVLALVAPSGCAAFTGQLSLNITQPAGSQVSYDFIGPNFSQSNTNVLAPTGVQLTPATLEPGTYTIDVTDQVTGCAVSDSEIIPTSAFTVTPTPKIVCGPDVIDVVTTSASAGTYVVRDATTGTIVIPVTPKPATLNFSTAAVPPGNYIVEVTIAGCLSPGNAAQTLGPQIPVTFDQSNLCAQSQLTAQGGTTYDWTGSPAGGLVLPLNTATVTVNPGTWTLQVIVDDGAGGSCPTPATISVTVDNFVPDFTFDPCTSPVILEAAPTNMSSPIGNYFYTWTGPPNGTGQQFSVTTSPGSFTLGMRSPATGCPARTISKPVTINGPLSVFITTNGIPCDGGVPFELVAVPSRTVIANGFEWSLEGSVIGGQNTVTLPGRTAGGLYAVTATDGQCEATAELDIFLSPATPGNLLDEVLICPDPANPDENTQIAKLDPGPNFIAYDWFEIINNQQSTLNFTEQVYETQDPGLYEVELLNSFGCVSRDRSDVLVDCDPVITGPNAFRPTSPVMEGGQPVNQQFRLFTFFIDPDNFQIYIFNRWGEMIFESSDVNFTWNGGYKNNASQLMPGGTYTYVVRYRRLYGDNKGTQEKRGGVLLLR